MRGDECGTRAGPTGDRDAIELRAGECGLDQHRGGHRDPAAHSAHHAGPHLAARCPPSTNARRHQRNHGAHSRRPDPCRAVSHVHLDPSPMLELPPTVPPDASAPKVLHHTMYQCGVSPTSSCARTADQPSRVHNPSAHGLASTPPPVAHEHDRLTVDTSSAGATTRKGRTKEGQWSHSDQQRKRWWSWQRSMSSS